MTTTLKILAGIFSLIAGVLFKFDHNYLALIPTVLALLAFVSALYANKNESKAQNHVEEKRTLFKSALQIIKLRAGIKLAQINDFKIVFEENKYFLNKGQEKTIKSLISHLGDVRIDDAELESNISSEQRKSFVSSRRKRLDQIEDIEKTIEKYLRKLT